MSMSGFDATIDAGYSNYGSNTMNYAISNKENTLSSHDINVNKHSLFDIISISNKKNIK